MTWRPQPPGLRHCPLRGLWRRYKGAASLAAGTHCAVGGPANGLQGSGGGWWGRGSVLGQDAGLTELSPVSPQVMETRQVPRSPRARLLLLLLLVSWGHRTASGAALPPAGVFRYVGHPGLPGRVGTQRGGKRPKEKGEQRLRKGEQRPRERTEMGGGQGISKTKRYTRI